MRDRLKLAERVVQESVDAESMQAAQCRDLQLEAEEVDAPFIAEELDRQALRYLLASSMHGRCRSAACCRNKKLCLPEAAQQHGILL